MKLTLKDNARCLSILADSQNNGLRETKEFYGEKEESFFFSIGSSIRFCTSLKKCPNASKAFCLDCKSIFLF